MLEDVYIWLVGDNLLVIGGLGFVTLAGAYEVAFRIGQRRNRRQPGCEGVSTIVGGMIGLLSFALGLTIGYAQDRSEARRDEIVVEANAIGTAWLRAKALGGEEGTAIAKSIEELAKTELAYTTARAVDPDNELAARRGALQDKIWELTQTVARRDANLIATVMMTAINEMFDAEQAERFAFESRVPLTLSWMLLWGALLAIAALGYQLGLAGARYPVLVSLLLLMWTGALGLIVDLNRPRLGSIHVDPAPLIWTIESFKMPSPAH